MNDLAYTILVFAAAVGGGAVLGFIAGHYAGYSDAIRAYGGWPKREAAPGAHVPRGIQVVKGLAIVTLAGQLGACASGRSFAELTCNRKADSNEVRKLDGGRYGSEVLLSSGPHITTDCTVKVRREGRDTKMTAAELLLYVEALK